MSERVDLILAAFFGNILAEVARYGHRWWQAMQRPRWKCPDCGLLMITEDRESLDLIKNAHQAKYGGPV